MVSQTQIEDLVRKAIAVLKSGGVVVFPTETAYGLAADATNSRAVERVMAIKGREEWKTPSLIVADRAMAQRYCELTPLLADLADRFWPGALTIVARVTQGLSSLVIRDSTIALRVSSGPIARDLSNGLGVPIVATSANRAGEKECYRIEDVRGQFVSQLLQPDFYLDVGSLTPRPPSTVVREVGGSIEVLRQGELYVSTREKIV